MKKKDTKNPGRKNPTEEIVASARSEALEIRYLNACAKINRLVTERERLNGLLAEETGKVQELKEAERIRVEKKKAAWKFAGKLGLMFLFAVFCGISAAGCYVYAPWWTMIAPIALFLGGLLAWLRWI